MNPIVSIITPTFNQERFIGKCIQTVLDQTYRHWEMIIIDDGSNDNTLNIIQQYNDPRIIYKRKEHQGIDHLGDNYNNALSLSRGEFIMILEGDDYVPSNRIEIQLPYFEDEMIVLSHGKYAYVFDQQIITYPASFDLNILNNNPIGSAFKVFLQGFNPIGSQSVMIRKSALLDIGGFTQPQYLPLVDYPTWMKLALKGTFQYIPEVLGYWRRHPNSVTFNQSERIFKAFLKYCDDFIETYEDELKLVGVSKSFYNRGVLANLSLSWLKLSKGSWAEAIGFGKKAWNSSRGVHWSFRAKIIIGLIGAYLHIDLPNYFKRLNRWRYQKQVEKCRAE